MADRSHGGQGDREGPRRDVKAPSQLCGGSFFSVHSRPTTKFRQSGGSLQHIEDRLWVLRSQLCGRQLCSQSWQPGGWAAFLHRPHRSPLSLAARQWGTSPEEPPFPAWQPLGTSPQEHPFPAWQTVGHYVPWVGEGHTAYKAQRLSASVQSQNAQERTLLGRALRSCQKKVAGAQPSLVRGRLIRVRLHGGLLGRAFCF